MIARFSRDNTSKSCRKNCDHFLILTFIVGCLLLSQPAWAVPKAKKASGESTTCAATEELVTLIDQEASSGAMGNYFARSGSLQGEIGPITERLLSATQTTKPAKLQCGGGCKINENPQVFLKIAPKKTQKNYQEAATCENLRKKTARSPIKFGPKQFDSVADIGGWQSDLALGKGADGTELYKRCPGNCSPEYVLIINPALARASKLPKSQISSRIKIKKLASDRPTKITGTVQVICGHARDQDDEKFLLKGGVRWSCE